MVPLPSGSIQGGDPGWGGCPELGGQGGRSLGIPPPGRAILPVIRVWAKERLIGPAAPASVGWL